jgi:hypothetical protein
MTDSSNKPLAAMQNLTTPDRRLTWSFPWSSNKTNSLASSFLKETTDPSLSLPTDPKEVLELLALNPKNRQNLENLIKALSPVEISDRNGFLEKLRTAFSGQSCLEDQEEKFLNFLRGKIENNGENNLENSGGGGENLTENNQYQPFSTVAHNPKMGMVMFDLGRLGEVNLFSNGVADLYRTCLHLPTFQSPQNEPNGTKSYLCF